VEISFKQKKEDVGKGGKSLAKEKQMHARAAEGKNFVRLKVSPNVRNFWQRHSQPKERSGKFSGCGCTAPGTKSALLRQCKRKTLQQTRKKLPVSKGKNKSTKQPSRGSQVRGTERLSFSAEKGESSRASLRVLGGRRRRSAKGLRGEKKKTRTHSTPGRT